MARRYWLVKSEPNIFRFADLLRSPKQTTCWDGVRNYQARNMLRDEMKVGDRVLFYHSRLWPMAVVGLATVCGAGYPDPSQFDPASPAFDPSSSTAQPRWFAVDLKAERAFEPPLTLIELRRMDALQDMVLLQKGSRLSVQPVRPVEFRAILHAATVAAKRLPAKLCDRKDKVQDERTQMNILDRKKNAI